MSTVKSVAAATKTKQYQALIAAGLNDVTTERQLENGSLAFTGKFKVGLPRIQVMAGEPFAVTQAKPSVASAKALTRQIEEAIETLRGPYGPPAHAWYPETSPAEKAVETAA